MTFVQTAAAEPRDSAKPDYVDLMIRAATDREMIALAARFIFSEFEAYYTESRAIPALAKKAFEERDPARSIALSRRRLMIYGDSIKSLAARLKRVYPLLSRDAGLWQAIHHRYLPLIRGRYEEDLATAYVHSVHRVIFEDEWRPVEYTFGRAGGRGDVDLSAITLTFSGKLNSPSLVASILRSQDFAVPFRDLAHDARRAAERLEHELGAEEHTIEMIDAGFYRNRGAYLVGRTKTGGGGWRALVFALENGRGGVYLDAVLTTEADAHNIFSSTLANFHVTDHRYHELSAFLLSIMPKRPLGLHYSTIGFNHVGKVAVMQELERELRRTGERFQTAVGFRGTVAMAFSAPSSAYVLKVIRDHPTDQYKWGKFVGIDSVVAKYRRVHEINRTGSMLDSIIFERVRLPLKRFDPRVALDLLAVAGKTVSLAERHLVFRYLIVQGKMVPFPEFLRSASPEDAETAIVNLGHCIRNNAAANIFNKDLDARNYGVSRYLKVFLFDYDAIEPLTDVKIRTNLGREEGEETVPDWFFEDGIVFLPEEIDAGLMINDRRLRRIFRTVHGELLTTEYWRSMQQALAEGRVPRIEVYPAHARLASSL